MVMPVRNATCTGQTDWKVLSRQILDQNTLSDAARTDSHNTATLQQTKKGWPLESHALSKALSFQKAHSYIFGDKNTHAMY